MVHHTESTEGEKNPHLTVENAHVLMFEDTFAGPGRDVRSKDGEGKQQHKQQQKKKEATPHEQLPLSSYLAFIVHALDVGGAPPEYGERLTALSTRMAQDKGLDTAGLFLRSGMDEPADNTDMFGPDRVPYLPTSSAEGADLVRDGTPPLRKLEPAYCTQYFGELVKAVNDFNLTPVLAAEVANQ